MADNLDKINYDDHIEKVADIKRQGIKAKPGRNLKFVDNNEKFSLFLKKYGLDKESFLKIADANAATFAQQVYLRSKALEVYTKEQEALADFLSATETRGITLHGDLVDLTADIAMRKQKMMAKDPDYDPLDDKPLQRALERKQVIIAQLDRLKLDVKKMAMDYSDKRDGGSINAEAVTVTDLDVSEFEQN
jgi:hypothetical protein